MAQNSSLSLVEELWKSRPKDHCCPHIRHDEQGCWCNSPWFDNLRASREDRQEVCDSASLQLWCLDGERAHLCIFFVS